MNAPLTSSGSFDPLAPAGGGVSTTGATVSSSFKPGSFVSAAIDNTAFFLKRPKGDAEADKLLARDTRMKVISSDSSYVKAELDSGEVGFVPAVMVSDPSVALPGLPPSGNEVQVYPPIDGVQPLPAYDPANMPADGVPPVIDPTAPVPGTTILTTPSTELPPGIDDVTPSTTPEAPAPADAGAATPPVVTPKPEQ